MWLCYIGLLINVLVDTDSGKLM